MSNAWSYSSLSLFQQCPKKYYHLKVKKDIVEKQTHALIYGNEVHKVAEEFVKEDKPIPEKYEDICKPVYRVKDMKGEKHCELRLGMTKELKPCKFFDDDVWWRGVIDLLIVNGDKGKIIDYKTGKNSKYADIKQLDLFTVAAFTHFPDLTEIKAGLLFLVTNDFITKSYNKGDVIGIMSNFYKEVDIMDTCFKEDVWNAKPNFTCYKYCPVVHCPHNGKR
jgi:hypothetical protein